MSRSRPSAQPGQRRAAQSASELWHAWRPTSSRSVRHSGGGGGASTGASTSAENFVMGLPSVFPPPNEYVDAEPRLSSEHITHTRSQLTGIYLIGHSWSIFIDHSLGAKFIDCPFIGNYNCQYMGNGLNCQFKGNINWPHMGNDSFPIHGPFIIGQSLEMIQLAIHGPFSLPIDWEVY